MCAYRHSACLHGDDSSLPCICSQHLRLARAVHCVFGVVTPLTVLVRVTIRISSFGYTKAVAQIGANKEKS